jgi:hypothetical protein
MVAFGVDKMLQLLFLIVYFQEHSKRISYHNTHNLTYTQNESTSFPQGNKPKINPTNPHFISRNYKNLGNWVR